jgi:hypothetical protein
MPIFFLHNKHIRGLYCFLRYLFFTRVKKKISLPNVIKNEEDDFINKTYINFESFNELPQDQYIQLVRNYEKRNLIINKSIKKTINNFNGQRVFRLTKNLKLPKNDYKKIKVLSVGPRNEGELYSLMSLGVKKKNITALDVHSYSPLIQVGMLETADFSPLTFDLITVGWILIYCKNLEKALKNLIKLSSRNTIITIGSTIKNKKQNDGNVSNKNIIKNLNQLNVNFDILVNKREQNTHNIYKIDLLVIKIK